jgi:hypothetical protein
MSAPSLTARTMLARRTRAASIDRTASWGGAMALLVLVVWLIPIKGYRLPVHLPFSLEVYRLLMIAYVVAWMIGILSGRFAVEAGALGKPIVLLVGVGLVSVLANLTTIDQGDLGGQALKSLSYFISFLVAYLLVHSTIRNIDAIEVVLRALVLGGVLVSFSAFYELRTHYNFFAHLSHYLPILKPAHVQGHLTHVRGGRLRVVASAQHPIALGAALMMMVPLAFYLASRARAKPRRWLWIGAGLVMTAGAVATISRTVALIALAMLGTGLLLRGSRLVRYWPLLVVMFGLFHVAAPSATGHLYNAFFPKSGLSTQLNGRAGQVGSGRLADIAPGIRSLEEAPIFGHGLGTGNVRGSVIDTSPGAIVDPKTGAPIIFDDQYMNSLVSIGILGFLGVLWFVWGGGLRLFLAARRHRGRAADLVAACAVAVIGFAAGMFTFDAFSFVQCTLLFFVVMALGERARRILLHE